MAAGDILPFGVPVRVPVSNRLITVLLITCSAVSSATTGFDSAMMNGLNILPSYNNYFQLNSVTRALNTASLYVGGCLAGLVWGFVVDKLGRRPALFWAAVLTLAGVALQTAAQHVAMFIIARIIVGFGNVSTIITAPSYLAETLPWNQKVVGLGILSDFYFVGALIASAVTYASGRLEPSTWAWRLPSALQGVFSLVCIGILPFLPESPRWLVSKGLHDQAWAVLSVTNGGTAKLENAERIRIQFREICDTLEFERTPEAKMSLSQIIHNPGAKKRLIITCSCAFMSYLGGNLIVSYYLGQMLNNAGIRDTTTQLQINVVLNAWCLVISLIGVAVTNKLGMKFSVLMSTGLAAIALFIVGGLTKLYGTSTYTPGVYATVAMIFIFMGTYSLGWTPVLYLVPAQVLNFRMRAVGQSLFQLIGCSTGLWAVFSFPIALDKIGWKTYLINGSWNLVMFAFIAWYWVEIRNKTLEEVDEVFDGVKHSEVVDVKVIEKRIKHSYSIRKGLGSVSSRM
ncbi:sugar transporter [Colletotrichum somersetense]|nr:sugar transporter [Colletotrichum somersetense]